ncbi:MAG: hypothetical protein ABI972_02105 [Acidobacteriota bacterium]
MNITHRTTVLLIAAVAAAFAQSTVAPTAEPVGRARGEDAGNYNVTNSFELGYRFHTVGGNEAAYRSDVNFGNGIRLLGSTLSVNSKEGHGKFFDEILLNTQGLGNDPYQFSSLRIQHNRWYRYDMNWRISDFVNPGLNFQPTAHAQNTRRMWQDHDLIVGPQSNFQLLIGYSRNSQDGPGLYTQNLFDQHRGDEFPIFADIHRQQREFRLGGQAQISKFKLILMRGWQHYDEDSPLALGASTGVNTTDATELSSFRSRTPYSGDTPFWRGNVMGEAGRWLAVNARFTYAGTRRDFTSEESAIGANRFGSANNRQFFVGGNGTRPVTTANLTFSLFPVESITVTNHTAFHQIQMDGNATMTQILNGSTGLALIEFRHLGIRTVVNTTDAMFRPAKWIGLHAGYQFSTRRIQSVEAETVGIFSDRLNYEQTNRVHAGLLGIRLQPLKPLTFNFDAEIGRTNQPFLPISEKNYNAFGARAQYKQRSLLLSAAIRTNYNTNSVSLFSHSSHSRNYSLDASWTPRRWVAFDTAYGKQHLDTLTGIAYFASGQFTDTQNSLYVSNVHAAHATLRFSVQQRVDLSLGYSRVQDTGDGRAVLLSGTGAFPEAQVFPLSFDSPQARVSIRLHQRLRLNFGYQYYRYGEEFSALRDYRAHTGFTSMLWSF